jgi:hypothetical protein
VPYRNSNSRVSIEAVSKSCLDADVRIDIQVVWVVAREGGLFGFDDKFVPLPLDLELV